MTEESEKIDFKKIMRKHRNKIIIIMILFFIFGILGSFRLIMVVLSKNAECLNNPFVYDAQRVYEEGMEIVCTCDPLDEKFNSFFYDRHGITFGEREPYFLKLGDVNLSLDGKVIQG